MMLSVGGLAAAGPDGGGGCMDSAWTPLLPGHDEEFGNATLTANEVAAIERAMAAAKWVWGGGSLLVHIGVGVGNPTSVWGNASADVKFNPDIQLRPGFLADANSRGHRVVSLLFNRYDRDNAVCVTAESATSIRIEVDAHFPLTTKSNSNQRAWNALESIVKEAEYVSVMNAVSQNPYLG